jgi:hypothetical protein
MHFQPFPTTWNGSESEDGAKNEVATSIFTSGKGFEFTKKMFKLVICTKKKAPKKQGNCGERKKWKVGKTLSEWWRTTLHGSMRRKNHQINEDKKRKDQRLT